MITPDAGAAPKPRVLVVDDERDNLMTFKRVFRHAYEIGLASSGDEAVRLLLDEASLPVWDVVILDFSMPGVTGAQVLTRVRTVRPNLPCIFLTAYAELPEVRAAARELGVVSIVAKPWDAEVLQRWIEQALAISRMKRSVSVLPR